MLPEQNNTSLLIIDMQERFAPAIHEFESTQNRIIQLASAAALMKMPVIVTEQYPKGLGPTVSPIRSVLPPDMTVFEKSAFSCMDSEPIRKHLLALERKNLILAGIESHICVMQTALAAAEHGFSVYLPIDAVSSRHESDKTAAVNYMLSHGIHAMNTESILFMLLKTSADPNFKAVQKLIR